MHTFPLQNSPGAIWNTASAVGIGHPGSCLFRNAAAVFRAKLGVEVREAVPAGTPYEVLAEIKIGGLAGTAFPERSMMVRANRRAVRLAGAAALQRTASLSDCMEVWKTLWRETTAAWVFDSFPKTQQYTVGPGTVLLGDTRERHSPRYTCAAACHVEFCGEMICAEVLVRD